MKKWLIAAAVGLLLVLWGLFGLSYLAAAMPRLLWDRQDQGAALSHVEQVGVTLGQWYGGYGSLMGALVIVVGFGVPLAVAYFFGRKSGRSAD